MSANTKIHITETPRDAMQGWHTIIPAVRKADYINTLLRAGFDTVDVGSLVSARAVPQMADTEEVIQRLEVDTASPKLMVVVGNRKGALRAEGIDKIQILGFPYSTSPTFLKRNINSDPAGAWNELLAVRNVAVNAGKSTRVYLSMAFGNPYGDPWSEEQILEETGKLAGAGFNDIVFSDITGEGSAESIGSLCTRLIDSNKGLSLGIHLHTPPGEWKARVTAAWQAGFRYFEGALGGYGGCPMSGYELLGNLDTSNLLEWCRENSVTTGISREVIASAKELAIKIFN